MKCGFSPSHILVCCNKIGGSWWLRMTDTVREKSQEDCLLERPQGAQCIQWLEVWLSPFNRENGHFLPYESVPVLFLPLVREQHLSNLGLQGSSEQCWGWKGTLPSGLEFPSVPYCRGGERMQVNRCAACRGRVPSWSAPLTVCYCSSSWGFLGVRGNSK